MLTDRKIDFEIIHKKRTNGYAMPVGHSHPYYEIGYFISGKRKILIEHTLLTMKEGDLFLIPSYVLHKAQAVESPVANSINLSFAPHYVAPLIERYGNDVMHNVFSHPVYHFERYAKKEIERMLHHMLIDFRHQDAYTLHEQELFIQDLFLTLLRHPSLAEGQQEESLSSDELRIQEITKYIGEHYDEDITLSKLTLLFGVSNSYFTHKFKTMTGFGFKEYLISIRIREACRLLVNSELSITEIAFKCGFKDSNYFGDAFKKAKGVSPRTYRSVSGFI